ncbi:MAG TPA: hypothetical protein VE153_01305 [Myxococcus sp.]|nr:hypothetical protein [Myxococcus sp.]
MGAGRRNVVAWGPWVVLLGLLTMAPARAQGPVDTPPSSSGIMLKDAQGPACGSSASGAGVPGLTLGETPPPTCRLRGVLLATSASEPSPGVRLTEVPGGSAERDRLLVALNTERIAMNWLALKVLGAWTLANITVGTVGYFVADERTWRAFHQMNALINVPILGTAVVGALILAAQDPERLTLAESLRRGVMLERGLFVGVTLDVLAATFGAFLWERGRRIDSGQLTGWGRSLVFQGALLLLYDSGLLLLNARYDTRLMMLLSPDARDGAGLAVRMRF